MATTAKGTPYVESSDLVADYPTVSLALAEHIDDFGGKVLQVVRATDTTQRTTTSTSYVDVTGMSVTITPQRSTSIILIIPNYVGTSPNAGSVLEVAVTDSSNNIISGAESARVGGNVADSTSATQTLIAYATPATTSATTYKLRFRVNNAGTVQIRNDVNTGQMYAIEVSA